MKYGKRIFFVLIAVLICISGCTKNEAEKTEAGEAGAEKKVSDSATKLPGGVVLYDGAGLSVKDNNGKMTVKLAANAGEAVGIFTETKNGSVVPVEENAVRVYDNEKRDFTKIQYDNKEYWIQSVFLGINGVPGAVIGEDVLISRTGKLGDWSTTKIPLHTFISVNTSLSKDGFYCITAYTDQLLRDVFVKQETVTVNQPDVLALKLFKNSLTKKDSLVKKTILQDALSLNSVFQPLIQAEINAIDGVQPAAAEGAAAAEIPATRTIDAVQASVFSSDGGKINIRSVPSVSGSGVVGQLESGVKITVVEETVEKHPVGESVNYWFKISAPLSGWIFGDYIEFSE